MVLAESHHGLPFTILTSGRVRIRYFFRESERTTSSALSLCQTQCKICDEITKSQNAAYLIERHNHSAIEGTTPSMVPLAHGGPSHNRQVESIREVVEHHGHEGQAN